MSDSVSFPVGQNNSLKPGPVETIYKYLIYLPLFVIVVGLSLSIAWLYLRYKIPLYNSGMSILIKDDAKSSGTSDAVLEGLGVGKKRANLANEIELLKTATLMSKVVDSLDLNLQYFTSGNVKRIEMYKASPFLYTNYNHNDSTPGYSLTFHFNNKGEFQVDGMGKQFFKPNQIIKGSQGTFVITIVGPGAINTENTYYVVYTPVFAMARQLAGALKIGQLNREASILTLGITTEIPQKGVDVLNGLVEAYNQSTVEDKNRVIDN